MYDQDEKESDEFAAQYESEEAKKLIILSKQLKADSKTAGYETDADFERLAKEISKDR